MRRIINLLRSSMDSVEGYFLRGIILIGVSVAIFFVDLIVAIKVHNSLEKAFEKRLFGFEFDKVIGYLGVVIFMFLLSVTLAFTGIAYLLRGFYDNRDFYIKTAEYIFAGAGIALGTFLALSSIELFKLTLEPSQLVVNKIADLIVSDEKYGQKDNIEKFFNKYQALWNETKMYVIKSFNISFQLIFYALVSIGLFLLYIPAIVCLHIGSSTGKPSLKITITIAFTLFFILFVLFWYILTDLDFIL